MAHELAPLEGDIFSTHQSETSRLVGLDALLTPVADCANDAPAARIEDRLLALRESLPPDLDPLTRESLKRAIREQRPAWPAPMVDAALAPLPRASQSGDVRSGKQSQASRLVDLALTAGAELWHSPAGDPHITLVAADHAEHYRLPSRPIRDWLAQRHHAKTGAVPGSQAIADALVVLAGKARYEGPEHATAVRVAAGAGGAVYLDLGDPTWRAVEITPTGWEIVARPPVRFLRWRGMRPLAAPTCGGSLDGLRDLLPVKRDDDYRLIVGWLLGALRPAGPFPVLTLAGEQGAGKSTVSRIVRRLIDPHAAELRAEPCDIGDVMIAASKSRVIVYDNLSHLTPWFSDALCRLSTGGAMTKRELYTDDDEVIIEAMRPTIVNSIADIVVRGDLLDRALVVTLPVLPESSRVTEADLWRRYDRAMPGLLGALLDAVVSALARERETTIVDLPRMADWATWVEAAEPGMGVPPGSTLRASRRMRGAAIETAIEGDPLAAAIRRLVRPDDGPAEDWAGTSTDLLARIAPPGRPPRGWPESPRALSAFLRRLAPGLRQLGIDIEHRREAHTGRRLVVLAATEIPPDQPSPSSPTSPRPDLRGDPGDGHGDDTERPSPASSPDPANVYRARDDGDRGDDVSRPSSAGVADKVGTQADALEQEALDRCSVAGVPDGVTSPPPAPVGPADERGRETTYVREY